MINISKILMRDVFDLLMVPLSNPLLESPPPVGSRVTDSILHLVPNADSFRTALRCVKVWAKARAIYSNVMGFFGGVAWAIVVARVCQMFPNATPASIVSKFFRIMHEWFVLDSLSL
jgi:poly(A) polymerase Pap1